MICIIPHIVPICPPLTAPDNGDIDCSLGGDGEANPGNTCTFTCDDGYELGGSTSRTCGDDGSWSDTDTICTKSMHIIWPKYHCSLTLSTDIPQGGLVSPDVPVSHYPLTLYFYLKIHCRL